MTGASGLLGINAALEYARDNEIVGIVHRARLETDRFKVLRADLSDPGQYAKIVDRIQPDWAMHCAAMADVDACEDAPALAERLNTGLAAEVAEVAANTGVRTLYVSTDAVFSGERGGFTEQDTPRPINVYAQTKLAGEHAVMERDPDALVVRVNFYGWSLGGRRSLAEWILGELSANRRLNGFTDVFFRPLLVNALARIMFRMLDKQLAGLFHVVGRDCVSKYDFAVSLADKFGHNSALVQPFSVSDSGLSAKRSTNLCLDTTKVQTATGRHMPALEAGLDEFHRIRVRGDAEDPRAGVRRAGDGV